MPNDYWLKDHFVGPKDTIRTVAKVISKSGIGVAIVVDRNQKMIGYVQDSDIRRAIFSDIDLSSPIEKIMSRHPFTLRLGMTRSEMLEAMRKAKRLRAPVVDDRGVVCEIALYWKMQDALSSSDFYIERKGYKKKSIRPLVLVVGGAGYIGSVLCRLLLANGFAVRVLDKLIYGEDPLKDLLGHDHFELIRGDILHTDTVVSAVFGVDTVVNLAAIVGDPACALDESGTIMINYISAKMLADISKHMKVDRYIFASTCSVYGASKGKRMLTEKSPLNPVSLYAETKLKTEWGVLELADKNFSPCVLRLATVFGLSPRPRFDLIVNLFTASAFTQKNLTVFGGNQYRPNIHVEDAARAFMACVSAPKRKIHGQVFNAGSSELNYTIREIAERVAKLVPGTTITQQDCAEDLRDYMVSFEKIRKVLGFACHKSIEDGVREIFQVLKWQAIRDPNQAQYSNFKTTFAKMFVEI
ncbi:MAG: NAD-dependent epimerase/dehydratase family protein [Candidatus Omnitrophica bacterium]|nr:NAD-dependent epimerase/dehydratase family protein [Candidatus Omnitrophota bacterium]